MINMSNGPNVDMGFITIKRISGGKTSSEEFGNQGGISGCLKEAWRSDA